MCLESLSFFEIFTTHDILVNKSMFFGGKPHKINAPIRIIILVISDIKGNPCGTLGTWVILIRDSSDSNKPPLFLFDVGGVYQSHRWRGGANIKS